MIDGEIGEPTKEMRDHEPYAVLIFEQLAAAQNETAKGGKKKNIDRKWGLLTLPEIPTFLVRFVILSG